MRLGDWGTGGLGVLLASVCFACGKTSDAPISPPSALTDSVPFAYPLDLWDHKISGETVLLMRVSELGAVDSVIVATPSGFKEFDSAAVQGARGMRFSPGRQGERRVAMWTKLPVRFARDTAPAMGLRKVDGTGADEEDSIPHE